MTAARTPSLDQAAVDARKLHRILTTLHGFIYFDPGAARRYEEAGLTGRSQYFASRGAALGAVGPGPVVATFFNFCPALIASCLPAAWERTTPEQMIEARYAAAADVLAPICTDADVVDEANALLAQAVSAIEPLSAGRALYAAHADIPAPTDPIRLLWHYATLLREWRGDGHVALLAADGTDPCDVLVIHAAAEESLTEELLRTSRGWSTDDFAAARERLVARGELTADGELTEQGRAGRQQVEDRTDELAAEPWRVLGPEASLRLRELLRPAARTLASAGPLARMAQIPSD